MRKHKIRKILHGLLDLLPLIVIPVFMIYSHRHTINDYSVVTEGATYQIEQGVINGKPNGINNITYDNVANLQVLNNWLEVYANDECAIYFQSDLVINPDNKLYISFECYFETISQYLSFYDEQTFIVEEDFDLTYQEHLNFKQVCTCNEYTEINGNVMSLNFAFNEQDTFFIKNLQVFNLTTIFGSGNEPTADEFSSMIGDRYFDYGETYNVFLPYGTTTYNNTDIGSQFIYSLYNTTTQYFNTDSVFNLKDLHSWIENNMFKGNMPLGVTIVYHIVVYEFIMDIIFLIYAVLMFVVDFATDFLEYCFSWSRRGGR